MATFGVLISVNKSLSSGHTEWLMKNCGMSSPPIDHDNSTCKSCTYLWFSRSATFKMLVVLSGSCFILTCRRKSMSYRKTSLSPKHSVRNVARSVLANGLTTVLNNLLEWRGYCCSRIPALQHDDAILSKEKSRLFFHFIGSDSRNILSVFVISAPWSPCQPPAREVDRGGSFTISGNQLASSTPSSPLTRSP